MTQNGWRQITKRHRNGNRFLVTDNDFVIEAWWEENLKTWVCMDSDWNLIPIKPLNCQPISAPTHYKPMEER